MPQSHRNTLFFIASPHYNLTSVENFLKKRGYDVHCETDVKAGLLRSIEIQPDFVFIALDHDHHKIDVLPQIIEQCLDTNIIPFTHSNTYETIKKLDENPFINKIYPPLSGPAVERMTIKLKTQSKKMNLETPSDRGSKHNSNLDIVVNGFLEQLNEKQKIKSDERPSNKAKTQSLKEKNSFFANAKKNKITAKQKENLKKNFEASIKSDLSDILETCRQEGSAQVIPLKDKKTIYCLLVQSKEWSGHLMAYSNTNLERHLLEPVFKNWISKEFHYFNEKESHVFFEIEINLRDFQVWVENKAEYYETLKVNDSELMLSFVGIEPKQLLVEFDEENDLMEVPLNWLPLKTDLNLSLYLHLPENKKYLLYTPKGQQLRDLQKLRLIENHVEKLFTPVEFDDEVKRLKMVQYFEMLFSGLGTESAE